MGIEFEYEIEGYSNYKFLVKANGLSGCYSFCLSKEEKQRIKQDLECLNTMEKRGETIIPDYDSESFIKVEYGDEQVRISGQMGNMSDENFYRFSFCVDQTIFHFLIDCL